MRPRFSKTNDGDVVIKTVCLKFEFCGDEEASGISWLMQDDKDGVVNGDYKQVVHNSNFRKSWESRGAGWTTKEVGVWRFVIGANRVVAFFFFNT